MIDPNLPPLVFPAILAVGIWCVCRMVMHYFDRVEGRLPDKDDK